MSQKSPVTPTSLLNQLTTALQQNPQRPGFQMLLEIIETANYKVQHHQQTEVAEAGAVYQNICTACFVTQFHPTNHESQLLEAIQNIAHPKGNWAGLNALNTANQWPSN
ncbi:bacteriocin immunity protein [Secundilactobacillus kimchicus]|nr:bacteriocin immunity protein [Secundilactobacillus kimchicus]